MSDTGPDNDSAPETTRETLKNGGVRLSRSALIGLVAVLGLSVAINVFIIGWVAGRGAAPDATIQRDAGGRSAPFADNRPLQIGRLADFLPEQDRRLLRRTLRDAAPGLRGQTQELRESLVALREAVSDPTTGNDAFTAALRAVLNEGEELRQQVFDILLSVAPQMTPQGREALSRFTVMQIVGSGPHRPSPQRFRPQFRNGEP